MVLLAFCVKFFVIVCVCMLDKLSKIFYMQRKLTICTDMLDPQLSSVLHDIKF